MAPNCFFSRLLPDISFKMATEVIATQPTYWQRTFENYVPIADI
jgi:hypothetical protein